MNLEGATDDERAGMAWWNALTETDRAFWLRVADTAIVAEAWAEYKRKPIRTSERLYDATAWLNEADYFEFPEHESSDELYRRIKRASPRSKPTIDVGTRYQEFLDALLQRGWHVTMTGTQKWPEWCVLQAGNMVRLVGSRGANRRATLKARKWFQRP